MAQVNNGLRHRWRSLGDDFQWDVFMAWSLGIALVFLFWWLFMWAIFEVATIAADLIDAMIGYFEREWFT